MLAVWRARLRRIWRHEAVKIATLTVSTTTLLIVFFVAAKNPAGRDSNGDAPAAIAVSGTAPSDVAKPFAEQAVKPEAGGVQPRISTDPLPVIDVQIAPSFTLIDSRTFGDDKATVILAGIETPSFNAVCMDDEGNRWACGLRARAALNNILRKGQIKCRGTRENSTMLLAACTNTSGDIALQMVAEGFARGEKTPSPYAVQEKIAREAARGLWKGRWAIINP